MGRSLNLQTIAEGVEFDAQADWLREAGCTTGQGYVWSRPIDHETLTRHLRDGFPSHIRATAKPTEPVTYHIS